MKNLLVIGILGLSACSHSKVINDVSHDSYGLFNADDVKDPKVEYKLCVGNAFWAVALSETIIAPIYFVGWNIMEPVGPKKVYK